MRTKKIITAEEAALLVKDGGELAVRIGLASVIRDLVPDGLVAAVTLDSSQA